MKWLIECLGQSFFYLVPIVAILLGGIFFVSFLPDYGFYLTVLWVFIVMFLYVKYTKWY
ncbi:hypothetical protein CTV95_09650 [Pectobacterium brasiliense]|nr:hypothetical protein CTV95_09650 [Pectobacterium brasiliense]